jgi:hypothetical protein
MIRKNRKKEKMAAYLWRNMREKPFRNFQLLRIVRRGCRAKVCQFYNIVRIDLALRIVLLNKIKNKKKRE